MSPPQLIYCYDPMCSWCWGFAPIWKNLQQELTPLVEGGNLRIRLLLGGLAKDSNDPMPTDMQQMLQGTWQRIEAELGTEFNYSFWTECQPRRSTYPACRACIVAREYGLEAEMILAIQKAYYLKAANPSDLDTLEYCAKEIGLPSDAFAKVMQEVKESGRLEQEIREARKMGLNSFPSLAVITDNQVRHINIDYQNPVNMLSEIHQAMGY